MSWMGKPSFNQTLAEQLYCDKGLLSDWLTMDLQKYEKGMDTRS